MKIADRNIGRGEKPFVIAELSGNHNQSLERALELVTLAARCGADAVKLQTYTADSMTLDIADGEFVIDNPASPWYGMNLHALYRQAHTPWEWHEAIFRHARELGIIPFSSAFDAASVDFLAGLDVPCIKIASFECIDLPLIARAARTGLPLIISTGMASLTEIAEAADAARDNGCRDLALLKCTTTYPASPDDSNLATIPHMRQTFGCEVGISDHTLGIGVALAGVVLGASIVEKHLTRSRDEGGVDAAFSLEPAEMQALVQESERAQRAVGVIGYGPSEAERPALKRRRSLYVTRDTAAGETLTADNLRSIRPGHGLPPKHLDQVLGRKINQAVKAGTPLTWDLLS